MVTEHSSLGVHVSEKAPSKLTIVGSVVGHIAVVASLLYVGYEIRLNTRVAKAQAHQDLVALTMVLGDPVIAEIDDVADLRNRADSGLQTLSPSDLHRFRTYSNRFFNVFELAYYQWREGLLEDDVWEGFRRGLEQQLGRRGFEEYWEQDKSVFGPEFARYVDGLRPR